MSWLGLVYFQPTLRIWFTCPSLLALHCPWTPLLLPADLAHLVHPPFAAAGCSIRPSTADHMAAPAICLEDEPDEGGNWPIFFSFFTRSAHPVASLGRRRQGKGAL
jgi:hypothetical protein